MWKETAMILRLYFIVSHPFFCGGNATSENVYRPENGAV